MNAIAELVGVDLGPTEWREVSQERIDAFAAATDDPQWIASASRHRCRLAVGSAAASASRRSRRRRSASVA